MISKFKLIGFLIVGVLISCSTKKNMESSDKNPLLNKWELAIMNGKEIDVKQPIYIELTEGDKVSGFLGCNRLTGSYTLKSSNQIKFNQLATTRMYCPDMKLETQALELLNSVAYYEVKDGILTLKNSKKVGIITFQKMNDNAIINKYWKLTKLNGQTVTMDANQFKEQYFTLRGDNTVNGFAGCNQFNGSYELKSGNRITFDENLAITMMLCPDVKVNEADFLNVFKLADNYTINGDVLNLNVGKRAPLAVFEAVYFD